MNKLDLVEYYNKGIYRCNYHSCVYETFINKPYLVVTQYEFFYADHISRFLIILDNKTANILDIKPDIYLKVINYFKKKDYNIVIVDLSINWMKPRIRMSKYLSCLLKHAKLTYKFKSLSI